MKKLFVSLVCIMFVNLSFSQDNQQADKKHRTFSIRLNPIRLFESSFAIHVERQIGKVTSIDLVPFVTYGTKNSGFLDNLYIMQESIDYNTFYSNSSIMGGGIIAFFKYFFDIHNNDIYGLYMSFFSMFRRTSIYALKKVQIPYTLNGYTYYNYETYNVVYNLNVFLNGVTFGYKKHLGNNFCLDVYIGGGLRLAKYDHQCITKYRRFGTFDYSGITPTFGLSIGFSK